LILNNIDLDQLWFSRVKGSADYGDNLVISILNSSDNITIHHWFENGNDPVFCNGKLDSINTADGRSLNINQVEALVGIMQSETPPLSYTSIIDEYLVVTQI